MSYELTPSAEKLLDVVTPHDYSCLSDQLMPELNRAKRTGCGKQVVSIEKKMLQRRSGYFASHSASPFTSRNISASTTPTPLTTDGRSLQTSSQPSVNGDAVEGAAMSRERSDGSG